MSAEPKRAGRGRPRSAECDRRRSIGVRLPGWLIDWLDSHPETRTEFIERVCRSEYDKAPK